MKLLSALLALVICATANAQKNEAAAYALGNFNPAYFATQTGQIFAGDNTAAIGYGVDYNRTLTKHNAIGILVGQDSVQAELFEGNNSFFRWKLRRYEVSILASQQFTRKRLTGFIFEGPGAIVTNGGAALSGWTGNFAIVTGFGVEYSFTKHFGERTRVSFEDSNTGCYGDRLCNQARWSVAQDLWSGLSFRW
jgi:hypothetical protein